MFDLPNVGQDRGTVWNKITVVFIIWSYKASQPHREHWIPSQTFPNNAVNKWQFRSVSKRWQAVHGKNVIKFLLCSCLHFGMNQHRQNEGKQGRHCLQNRISDDQRTHEYLQRTVSAPAEIELESTYPSAVKRITNLHRRYLLRF